MAYLRNFVFTSFQEESFLDDLKKWPVVKYLVYGREVCPTTGKSHLQGYCELSSSRKFSIITKKIPSTHLEARKGTSTQAADYCKKDGDFFEQGSISQAGKRNDIHAATEMILNNESTREVALEHPVVFVKYHRGLHAFRCAVAEPRCTQPRIVVLWGDSGLGKSRMAREQLLSPGFYSWSPNLGPWFDGYHGQEEVLFEEFRGHFPFGQLLTLLDRYDTKVQPKGLTATEFCGTKIVITSPVHPNQWYENLNARKEGSLDQLTRRLDQFGKVIEIKKYQKLQADIRDFFLAIE